MLEPLGRGRDPVFSPDGEWIVYSARVGGGWRLRRMRSEGGGRLPLGRGVRDEIEPAVSPDGSLVAYVSEEGGLHRLFVRRIDGSGDRLLLPDGAVARPVW
jgi:TolB protein